MSASGKATRRRANCQETNAIASSDMGNALPSARSVPAAFAALFSATAKPSLLEHADPSGPIVVIVLSESVDRAGAVPVAGSRLARQPGRAVSPAHRPSLRPRCGDAPCGIVIGMVGSFRARARAGTSTLPLLVPVFEDQGQRDSITGTHLLFSSRPRPSSSRGPWLGRLLVRVLRTRRNAARALRP